MHQNIICVGGIISRSITFNIVANIFEMILYTTLHRDICPNCDTSSGDFLD